MNESPEQTESLSQANAKPMTAQDCLSSIPIGVLGLLLCGLMSCDSGPTSATAFANERPWPSAQSISGVDDPAAKLGTNSSGLTYQPAQGDERGYLWAIKNGPAELQQLVWDGNARLWRQLRTWSITTPSGATPDSEAVTKAQWNSPVVYIAAEKENRGNGKLLIIAFDTQSSRAIRVWDLTLDPKNPESVDENVGNNNGWEGLTWVPDADLVTAGFYDERLDKEYSPLDYPGHGEGLYFAGLEKNGHIYVYALAQASEAYYRIAVIDSGFPAIMGLEYDRSSGYLWAHCDNTCGNASSILHIDAGDDGLMKGRFRLLAKLQKPATLANSNHEGIAMFPDSECDGGLKPFLWLDDSSKPGRSVSAGSIPCGRFLD